MLTSISKPNLISPDTYAIALVINLHDIAMDCAASFWKLGNVVNELYITRNHTAVLKGC